MTEKDMDNKELAARLEALREVPRGEWRVEKEPHDYPDGTTEFTHVRYTSELFGEKLTVEVARYVTPELAELLCLLHNNLDKIIPALRATTT
jgi:hypothetical protein